MSVTALIASKIRWDMTFPREIDCLPFSRDDFQLLAEGGLYLKRMIFPII